MVNVSLILLLYARLIPVERYDGGHVEIAIGSNNAPPPNNDIIVDIYVVWSGATVSCARGRMRGTEGLTLLTLLEKKK